MTETTINISTKTIFTILFTLIGFLLLFMVKDIVISLFVSLIIMSALNPAVNWLERKKVSRTLAIVLVYFSVFGVFGVLFGIIVPPLATEISNMVKQLQLSSLPKFMTEFKFTVQDVSSIISQVGTSITSVLSVITNTFSSIFFFFTLLVMSFYLLLERKTLHTKFFLFPHTKKMEEIAKEFVDRMEIQLGGWVRGQLMLMFCIGFFTFVVLTILSIPYALPLAVLAGFLEILPNIGPTIAAIPAILITFIVISPTMAGIVLIMYVVIQQFENNLIVPKIMKAAVNVEPLTSILLILTGIKIGGVMGALLAIPIYIIIRSAFEIYLRETQTK